jgi:hypothetical protein
MKKEIMTSRGGVCGWGWSFFCLSFYFLVMLARASNAFSIQIFFSIFFLCFQGRKDDPENAFGMKISNEEREIFLINLR